MVRKLALLAALLPAAAFADRVTVPVDFGIGPAAYWFFGPLTDNRGATPHFGLKINVDAVIDADWIARNPGAIPPRYRKQAEGVTEVRISPSIFIPDALIISPKLDSPNFGSTGMFGITWRPVGVGIPLAGGSKPGQWKKSSGSLAARAGLIVTYAYIYSDFPAIGTTHFIRPGIDLALEMELRASDRFLISLGWASQLYIPQRLGAFDIGPLEEDIFHVGQAFLKFHFRFPYEANL